MVIRECVCVCVEEWAKSLINSMSSGRSSSINFTHITNSHSIWIWIGKFSCQMLAQGHCVGFVFGMLNCLEGGRNLGPHNFWTLNHMAVTYGNPFLLLWCLFYIYNFYFFQHYLGSFSLSIANGLCVCVFKQINWKGIWIIFKSDGKHLWFMIS